MGLIAYVLVSQCNCQVCQKLGMLGEAFPLQAKKLESLTSSKQFLKVCIYHTSDRYIDAFRKLPAQQPMASPSSCEGQNMEGEFFSKLRREGSMYLSLVWYILVLSKNTLIRYFLYRYFKKRKYFLFRNLKIHSCKQGDITEGKTTFS